MKFFAVPLVFALTSLPFASHVETLVGYDFDNYKVPVYNGKKAPLNWVNGQTFAPVCVMLIKKVVFGFGGNYIVAMWGCGAGCLSEAMIDKRSGKVYGIPAGEGTHVDMGCYEEGNILELERVVFYPNSRLFITRNCESEPIGNTNTAKQITTHFLNVCNEKAKKFQLLKEVTKTKVVRTE